MIHPRSYFAAVRLPQSNNTNNNNNADDADDGSSSQEKVIVMGGWNNTGVLDQCEMLHMTTHETVELSRMNVCRYGFAAVALSATEIMVIGGHDGSKALDTVEVYDTETNQWTLLPGTLSTPRSMCAAVKVEDRVYVMGGIGISRWEPLDSCEILDLTHHIRSRSSNENNTTRI